MSEAAVYVTRDKCVRERGQLLQEADSRRTFAS